MENLIKELSRTFFQQLPNGLCLIFAIGVVVSLVFTLPKRKHHNPLYLCFWLAVLFMVGWRLVVGLVAVRYVTVLIIPAVMMTAFVGFRAESWWRWLRKKFTFLPRWVGPFASKLLVYGCSAGALAMAIYTCCAKQDFYVTSHEIIKEYCRKDPAARVLTQSDESERIRYYTGIKILGLAENSKSEIKKHFRCAEANRNLLVIVRDRPKYSRIEFAQNELPPGAAWELYRRVSRNTGRKRKNKELNVYLYKTPVKAVPCDRSLPLAASKGDPALKQERISLAPGKKNVNVRIGRSTKPGNYTLEFFIKGTPGSVVEVVSSNGKATEKWRRELRFKLPDEKIYRCSAVITVSGGSFKAGVKVRNGKAVVDELCLTPLQMK